MAFRVLEMRRYRFNYTTNGPSYSGHFSRPLFRGTSLLIELHRVRLINAEGKLSARSDNAMSADPSLTPLF